MVKRSRIHSYGLFAKRTIEKDREILSYGGRFAEMFYGDLYLDAAAFFFGLDNVRDAKLRENYAIELTLCSDSRRAVLVPYLEDLRTGRKHASLYINHQWATNDSDCPVNVVFQEDGQIRTLRAIKAGEEIIADYGVGYWKEGTQDAHLTPEQLRAKLISKYPNLNKDTQTTAFSSHMDHM